VARKKITIKKTFFLCISKYFCVVERSDRGEKRMLTPIKKQKNNKKTKTDKPTK